MKRLLTTLTFLFLFATATATEWGGTYNTNFKSGVYSSDHGNIHLISSRSGSKAVGLYNTKGHILLSSFTISGRATVFTGSFSNSTSKGKVAFTQINNKKWDGDWKYDSNNLPPRSWNGSWDGNFLNDTKLNGLYLWNTFETDLGTMELIHNESGKVGGFLYADGKEYYIYGRVGGAPNNLKFSGFISKNEDQINTSGPYTLTFDWKNGMYGKATIPGQSQKTFRGATHRKKLKITLISIKNYENKGLMHGEEKGKLTLNLEGKDGIGRLFKKDLYKDTRNITWKENRNVVIDEVFEHNLVYTVSGVGYYDNPQLYFNLDYKRMRSISNAQDPLADIDKIDLKPILEYLEFKRSASSFSDAADGRKNIPGSDHTFWLGDDGGNIRMVKGYAFKKYSNNNKWGYFYFLSLE